MVIEPAYDPDGSVAAWLCYRMDRYIGSVCRTGPARWQANNAEGGIIAVARTRKQALAHISDFRMRLYAQRAPSSDTPSSPLNDDAGDV